MQLDMGFPAPDSDWFNDMRVDIPDDYYPMPLAADRAPPLTAAFMYSDVEDNFLSDDEYEMVHGIPRGNPRH